MQQSRGFSIGGGLIFLLRLSYFSKVAWFNENAFVKFELKLLPVAAENELICTWWRNGRV